MRCCALVRSLIVETISIHLVPEKNWDDVCLDGAQVIAMTIISRTEIASFLAMTRWVAMTKD